VADLRKEVAKRVGKEGAMRSKPKGFTDLHALELFGMTGDLFAKPPEKK
jgi:hypothetical protein